MSIKDTALEVAACVGAAAALYYEGPVAAKATAAVVTAFRNK